MFPKPLMVKSLDNYKIWLKYSDDVEGELDLSHLAHKGVFNDWDENDLFSKVYISNETNAIAWNKIIELCPNSLYLELRNMTFREWEQTELEYATN